MVVTGSKPSGVRPVMNAATSISTAPTAALSSTPGTEASIQADIKTKSRPTLIANRMFPTMPNGG